MSSTHAPEYGNDHSLRSSRYLPNIGVNRMACTSG